MPDIPPFTLRQLRYLLAIAEHESLSAAATQLHVSDSALSAALTDLERAVGVRLLVRRRAHGATLTAAGRDFTLRARRVIREAVDLSESVGDGNDDLSGVVRVGASEVLAPLIVARLVRAVGERHPRLRVEFSTGGLDDLGPRLEQGHLDLVLSTQRAPDRFVAETLFEFRTSALLAADHPLAGRETVDIGDLVAEPFVMLDTAPARENALAIFAAAGVEPRLAHATPSLEMVRSLVGQRLGYSLQILHPTGNVAYDGSGLVTRPLAPGAAATTVPALLVRPRDPSPGAQVVEVVRIVREIVGGVAADARVAPNIAQ